MNDLERKIREAAKREGIDLIGFAPKERFDGVDAAHNPFSIFPEGKTVVLVGKRVCRGSAARHCGGTHCQGALSRRRRDGGQAHAAVRQSLSH